MTPQDLSDLASIAGTVLGCMIPAAIHIGGKIQKVATDVVRANAEIAAKLKVIEVQMASVHEELKAARNARAELWSEVNGLRERVAKVEAENG